MPHVLHTGPDKDPATRYLDIALQRHSQTEVARYLSVSPRTVRHWIAKQPTEEYRNCLVSKLSGGEFFIAEQVGISVLYSEPWALLGDDHVWHTFNLF